MMLLQQSLSYVSKYDIYLRTFAEKITQRLLHRYFVIEHRLNNASFDDILENLFLFVDFV